MTTMIKKVRNTKDIELTIGLGLGMFFGTVQR